MSKLRVLWYSDFLSSTGFAQVAHNMIARLHATGKYEFDVVGINHGGEPYDKIKYPYDIYPAIMALSPDPIYKDVYGRGRLLHMAGSGAYDIVFMLQDTFIVETFMPSLIETRNKLPKEKQFPIVMYFPIDGTPKKSWIENVVAKIDFPVTYTEYAKKECLKHLPNLTLPVIYHGVDKSVFYPIPTEEKIAFKERFLGKHKDKYLVLNVSRNQPRKDLIRTMSAFKLFHDKNPNSFLFLLCQARDVGGDVIAMGENLGLVWDEDFACPSPGTYGANQGYTIETVNKIYNIADLTISSSLGEGWGLQNSESFAVQVPTLVPKNTSFEEIIGEEEERGYFCESGADLDHFVCLGQGDNNILRPVVNVLDMADKMCYIYEHPKEAQEKVYRAYNDVWTWDTVCEKWKDIFDKAEIGMRVLRGQVKYERNEKCFCNSGLKFKNCHGK
jgi:glycosyltransferase involved in cell wall biosynthesis